MTLRAGPGILFGERPRLTGIENLTDIEAHGLSYVGNGHINLEIFADIQVVLEEIRRAREDPINIKFIVDTS